MKRISTINGLFSFMILFMLLLGIWGCRKETLVMTTTSDVNITAYLDNNPAMFSEWRKVLELTGNASFLNAYGAYTMFTPTNDAVKAYLKDKGKTSVDQIDVAELKDLVRFHLLSDTIRTTSFTDGKLPSLTMFGQYLITGSKNVGGVTQTIINRQAVLLQSDINLGNGIIQVIDHILQPAKFSVAQLIENDPKYSIFSQALKATGLYDTLNILPINNPVDKMKFLTLIAESDSVLKVAGFNTYADLFAKYSTGSPKSVSDGLHAFIAYHIIYDAKYLADIASAQAQATLAPLEIITTNLFKDTIKINDVTFLGVHEIGAVMNRVASDNSATNGVVNSVFTHFDIKVRKPVRVDWDVADFPEMRKLTAYYRKAGYSFSIANGQPIKDWFMPGPNALNYVFNASGSSSYGLYQDFLEIPLGPPGRSPYIDMKTPMIVRGKYKVWIGWRGNGSVMAQISVDGVALPKIINFKDYLPSGTIPELEAQGWKHYMVNTTGNFPAKLLGVIDIQTTDRHTLRIQSIKNTGNSNWVDLIQFIPIADDQLYPQFNSDGSMVARP
jgi:uncharacterized surface protein with fasciclin (FAS1) repeats